jgi:hypothetical protein
MLNLAARTEINDAWANLALVDSFLRQCKRNEAGFALRDAERHYIIQHSDSTPEKLADLRRKLDQIRVIVNANSEEFQTGNQRNETKRRKVGTNGCPLS